MKAVAIILAAGGARRMSHPKANIEHEGGKSFLQSLASTFGKAGCTVLGVVGKDSELVREMHPRIHLVESERWLEGGLLASAQAGIQAALDDGADVVLLHPVDMPAVRVNTLKTMLKSMGEAENSLRPEFEGAAGWPVMLSRAAAERLLKAGGTALDPMIEETRPRRMQVKDPGVVVNINTPEIYKTLFTTEPKPAPPPKRRTKEKSATNGSVSEATSPTSYAASPEE
ncbi:nucleotidyltransferase family protein [Corallococcus terminator]|uniref:Purine catabolism protein PucB n=1 Tax=Corallococcus terminator TaxID=2316733 RepID=A0A3A8I3J0_9BACT|nr:NTP transferase domain-containing protein [Corallococcus terminator]RKG77316.1 purine catabolism protein PucB [Corallococcus terminator]